jgi:hypothetical protein
MTLRLCQGFQPGFMLAACDQISGAVWEGCECLPDTISPRIERHFLILHRLTYDLQ